MEAPERGGLTLVRLVGVMLIVATILEMGLYLAKCFIPGHHLPVEVISVLIRLIPAVIGGVVLVKARAIADWIAELLDQ
jgi:hypothetical protein